MKQIFILFLFFSFSSSLWAESNKQIGIDLFLFETPKNWKKERIPFPLGFAPEVNYPGFEELRFAPGMFDVKSDTYFSYAFLFWAKGKVNWDKKLIQKDLHNYYRGLCKVVAKDKKMDLDLSKIKIVVTPVKENKTKSKERKYKAVLDWYDPFVTGKPLTLYFDIRVGYCTQNEHSYLISMVSPQTLEKEIWKKTFLPILSQFRCHKEIEIK